MEPSRDTPEPALARPDPLVQDTTYWERVLGDSYAAHLQQEEQERMRIERSLGKGKRQRKKINYAEAAMLGSKETKVRDFLCFRPYYRISYSTLFIMPYSPEQAPPVKASISRA